jgi:hypothetical protein
MGVSSIRDWNDVPLAVRFSRGASRVPYVEGWRRNVVGLQNGQAHPDWLERQVRTYTARRGWFDDADADALSAELGRISKFQSLRSEDALTWSWFGTLTMVSAERRQEVIQWMYDALDLRLHASRDVQLRQWERVMHPNARSPNGPEIDAIIDDPGAALIYVEAKWRADLGTGRGASIDKPDDQIVLRRDSMRKDPALRGDERTLVVLGVTPVDTGVDAYAERDPSLRPVSVHWLTWQSLATCSAHPHAVELQRYLDWRDKRGG